jgi:hypothetical protein
MPINFRRLSGWALLICVLAACGGSGNGNQPKATPTTVATATATNPPTATSVPTQTAMPSPTPSTPPTVTATATASATATGTPTNTPSISDELAAVGLGRYLDITPSSMTPGDPWDAYFYDPSAEQAICLRGDQYQVEVRHGTSNKVLLYLEGGGACWNYQNCWQSPTAKLTAQPSFGAGIFTFDNPDNPFGDWNIVFAPYCDGSVFGGDNIADYQGNRTYHHGVENLSAAVALMRAQFPNPELIAVAGSSAGGYGTFSGYGVTRVAYPDTPIVVLDDSGPGLQNPAATQDVQDRADNWKFTQFIPPSCTSCSTQITYLTEWALDRDSTLRVGYFSNLRDGVIRIFLQLDADAYEALLLQVTDDIHSRQSERFKRFFIQGESHTVLELPSFYTTEITGITMRDWTAGLLTDGPGWQDLVEGFNPFKGFSSDRYADESLWLCRPDLTTNQCFVNDLDASEVEPDNSLIVMPHTAGGASDYDCFYIYPTVDLSSTPGNHTDFSDISLELDPLLSQAARFNASCRIFAPLYRQVTLGTFGSPDADQYTAIAYGDVEEAFRHYMGQYNNGRNFVIMGHSQGTLMVTTLLHNLIDGEPALRARLITALLLGGGVTVPDGQTAGGTFQNLPLCTTADQTGCVIAYRSYADGYPPAGGSNVVGPDGMDTACTNPAALGGGKAYFGGTYLPLHSNQPLFNVGKDVGLQIQTPFSLYREFFTGECVRDDHNRSYLRVGVEPGSGDMRLNPIDFTNPVLTPSFLGTHILDYNWSMGDLITLVEEKAAALKAAQVTSPPPPTQ